VDGVGGFESWKRREGRRTKERKKSARVGEDGKGREGEKRGAL